MTDDSQDVSAQMADAVSMPWWKRRAVKIGGMISGIIVLAASTFVGVLATRGAESIDAYNTQVVMDRDALIAANAQISNVGGEYLFDQPLESIGPPPEEKNSCDGRYSWAKAHGGVDVESTVGRVTVSAAENNQVTVVGIKPVPVGQRKPPSIGAIASCSGRGGGPKFLTINLDNGKASFSNDNTKEDQPFSNIQVPAGESYGFDFLGVTLTSRWDYRIEMTLNVNGNTVTQTIDDNGKPFETSARNNAKIYDRKSGVWVERPPATQSPPGSASFQPADNQDPCKLVSDQDVAAELATKVRGEGFGGPTTGAAGFEGIFLTCLHKTSQNDMVQSDYAELKDSNQASIEFEKRVVLSDPKGTARDLAGFPGPAKIINNSTVVVLVGNKIFSVSCESIGGKSESDRSALAQRLAVIGVDKLK